MDSRLYTAGRYAEAQAALETALEINPQAGNVHSNIARVLLATGRPQQALIETEREPIEWSRFTSEALIYQALGGSEDSSAALNKLIDTHQNDAAYQIAQVYAYRGNADKAFDWLDRAYRQRDAGMAELKTDPLFIGLQKDPRYAALLKRMQLPA